jgi:hypothetical protein
MVNMVGRLSYKWEGRETAKAVRAGRAESSATWELEKTAKAQRGIKVAE